MDNPDLAIFYADGSIVECSNGDQVEVTVTFKASRQYLEAPSDGIQAIVQYDEVNKRHVLRGKDYYHALPSGLINSCDSLAPFLNYHFPGLVKYGLCLDTKYWNDVMQKVKAYTGIPRL